MKTDHLSPDLFLEAEEALRGVMSLEHRRRMPLTPADMANDTTKLAYLRKLADRAGLLTACDEKLLEVLVGKMDKTSHTRMTLEDFAEAVLKAVAEELASLRQ